MDCRWDQEIHWRDIVYSTTAFNMRACSTARMRSGRDPRYMTREASRGLRASGGPKAARQQSPIDANGYSRQPSLAGCHCRFPYSVHCVPSSSCRGRKGKAARYCMLVPAAALEIQALSNPSHRTNQTGFMDSVHCAVLRMQPGSDLRAGRKARLHRPKFLERRLRRRTTLATVTDAELRRPKELGHHIMGAKTRPASAQDLRAQTLFPSQSA